MAHDMAALRDGVWIEDTTARLRADAVRMDDLLRRHGLAPVGGTLLFRLAAAEDAHRRWERLGRAGVMVRRQSSALRSVFQQQCFLCC